MFQKFRGLSGDNRVTKGEVTLSVFGQLPEAYSWELDMVMFTLRRLRSVNAQSKHHLTALKMLLPVERNVGNATLHDAFISTEL